jgi:hypothetical protein
MHRKTVSAGAESSVNFWPKPKPQRNSYFQPKLAETETESSVGHYLLVRSLNCFASDFLEFFNIVCNHFSSYNSLLKTCH